MRNIGRTVRRTLVALVLATLVVTGFFVFSSPSAMAATTLPTKMNFQGRLASSSGSIMPNGTYNMRFRIYNASTGGTVQWSEDRLVSASQGVTVTNGIFSVQLGSVTSLPASVFTSNSLYFEVELPTPGTATSSSPSWTEGAMTPRNQLATSAYAYNSETLDGLDSDAFAQVGATNTYTGINTFNGASVGIGGVASATKFNVANLFNVDSTNGIVSIGVNDATGTTLVVDTKNTSGDPTGSPAVNGAIYYNSNAGKFRCYEGGGWKDCVTTAGASTSSANTFTADNTFRPSTNSVTALQVQNSSSQNLFQVDTTGAGTVSLLGNNSGETTAWTTSANALPDTMAYHGTAVANGYVYALANGATAVYYAKLNSDGTVGTWNTSPNALPSARISASTVAYGGYMYVFGGSSSATGYSAKLNADGTTGPWRTLSNAMPAFKNYVDAVVSNGYMYMIGGESTGPARSSVVYYTKLNGDGTTGAWQTAANTLPQANNYNSVVSANGYIYVIAGEENTGNKATTYRSKIATDGTVGAWTTLSSNLPQNLDSVSAVINNGYVYVFGGFRTAAINNVYYAKVNTDGTFGAWNTSTNTLPNPRYALSTVVANGYAYAIGGSNGTYQSTVYHARLGGTVQVGGSIDLVGPMGQTLSDGGDSSTGSSGGSVTAGNITAVGTLQVNRQALFGDSASVTGDFNAGAGLFSVNTGTGTVQVGSSLADGTATPIILDTKNTSGDPTGTAATNGAMYYNSNSGKFRCYENTAWKDCITAASTPTLQNVYDNSSTPATITTSSATKSVAIRAGTGFDQTALFDVDDAAGISLFTIDSLNDRIYIGNATADTLGTVLVLDTKSGATDPTGVNGAMYYNAALAQFRCFRDTGWEACATKPIDRGYSYEDDFFSGATAVSAAGIGNLNWQSSQINTNGCAAYSYNTNAAPLPTADRPGILKATTSGTALATQGCRTYLGSTNTGTMALAAGQVIKASVAPGSVTAGAIVMRVGNDAGAVTSGTAPTTSGVWWEADPTSSANWRYCYSNGSAATCAASTVALAVTTFARLEIRINSVGSGTSSADFYVNGIKYSVTGVTINNATLVRPSFLCITGTVATASVGCYIDYYQLRADTSTAR